LHFWLLLFQHGAQEGERLRHRARILKSPIFGAKPERINKPDRLLPPKKLTLFHYRFSGILPNHEGIRRTALFWHRCIFLFISWTRHQHSDECNVLHTLLASLKGYRTMLASHDQFTQLMCDRLTTTIMGLGLVRLLQDAKRFEEARTTLYLLEGAESDQPSKKPCKAKRITRSRSAASVRIEAA
jgi:hypothetical protein